ncbi:hypothetical protein JAF94_000719 [Citrobacter braakii]|nr:hypothetical protein [Citrobacter braakii]
MIQKGSQRVGAARTGALSGLSCTCMKTTTQSGQAWRGYERALAGFLMQIIIAKKKINDILIINSYIKNIEGARFLK